MKKTKGVPVWHWWVAGIGFVLVAVILSLEIWVVIQAFLYPDSLIGSGIK